MRILCINLARATARRQAMERQFRELGLAAEFLTALDGRALAEADRVRVDHHRRRAISPFPLSDNEVACCLSHQAAMRCLLDGPEKMLAVVEDDVALFANFPATIAAIEQLAAPFDVIDLHRRGKRGEIFARCGDLGPENAIGRVGYTHMNLQGYVVSRHGAEAFLAANARIGHAVDKELHRWWANGLELYGLEKPVLVEPPGTVSMIDETRGERLAYADGYAWRWRVARAAERALDSVRKRAGFAAYVRRGRKMMKAIP